MSGPKALASQLAVGRICTREIDPFDSKRTSRHMSTGGCSITSNEPSSCGAMASNLVTPWENLMPGSLPNGYAFDHDLRPPASRRVAIACTGGSETVFSP